jgi:hypothetical protein
MKLHGWLPSTNPGFPGMGEKLEDRAMSLRRSLRSYYP